MHGSEGNNNSNIGRWVAFGRNAIVSSARAHPLGFWNGALAIALLLVVGAFAWSTIRAAASVERDVSEVLAFIRGGEVHELTPPEAYATLTEKMTEVQHQLGSLRQRAAVFRGLRWIPGIGPRVEEATLFLDIADHFVRGTRLTLQGYGTVVYALEDTSSQVDIANIRQNLEGARPLFAEARNEFDKVAELRTRLGTPSSLGARAQPSLNLIDEFASLMELAVIVGRDTPQLVGELLDLRSTVANLRHTLDDPSAFLEQPSELAEQFKRVQQRSLDVQGGILIVKNAMEGEDNRTTQALDTALQMSALLATLSDGLARVAAAVDGVLTLGPLTPQAASLLDAELPRIRETLQAAQQELDQLNTLLEPQELDEAGSSLVTLVGVALGSPVLPLQREQSLLATGAQVVDFLTLFLGYESPKKYLLIGQNDDEIRATGGFIGVVVEMTLDRGELIDLRYLDSTTVDAPPYDNNPLPPEPVYRYLWMGKLLFRDGNWNPHFPASAAQLADLYERGQGVQVDGVLAATEEVVLDMVEALGGVRVMELPDLLNRRIAERYIEGDLPYACLPRHVSKRPKRCFSEDLFQVVIDMLLSPIPTGTRARAGAVQVMLSRLKSKDLLLHVFDPETAELLWERDWNGALKQVDHDYLMIVDSSLPGHARSVVERRVQYQVSLTTGEPLNTELFIEYRHNGTIPDPDCRQALPTPTGCYWNFLRVYIPVVAEDIQLPPIPLHQGSEWLIWGYEPVDSASLISSPRGGQAGLTEIGGYLTVEPQTSVTLPLKYRLPFSSIRDIGNNVLQYRLLVQKQPGAPVEPVTVMVRLPEGGKIVRASPSPTAQADGWVHMDVDLAGDVTFIIDFTIG